MRELSACLFDLDGVICDTAKYHYLAWKALADEVGIPFTEKDNERLKGVSREDSLEILLKLGDYRAADSVKRIMADKKNKAYVEFISQMDESEILPGVLDFLEFCRENHILTALGSVSRNAPVILERLKLKPYFQAVIDGTKVERAKPDPEVFLKGARELKALPKECVVFEDARAGIEAAKRAQMMAVGIGDPKILTEADLVIKGFGEKAPKALWKQICGERGV